MIEALITLILPIIGFFLFYVLAREIKKEIEKETSTKKKTEDNNKGWVVNPKTGEKLYRIVRSDRK